MLLEYTKLTPAHIIVLFTVTGAFLSGLELYEPFLKFAGGGALIPVLGFGNAVTTGVVAEAKRLGLVGLFTGVFELTGLGVAAAVVFGFLAALVSAPKNT